MKVNDIDIVIHKSWYNKSQVQEDGVTHIIDTSTQYPLYQLCINKNYFDYTDDTQLVKDIIKDLNSVISKLQQLTKESQERE